MLFTPKKWKYKKQQKGAIPNRIKGCLELYQKNHDKIVLKSEEFGIISSKQINSLRQTVNKLIKKKGTLRINIFPHMPITKKPVSIRMGKGKGNVDHWIAKIEKGTQICEIEIQNSILGIQALGLAKQKLPVKSKIVYNK